MREHRLFSLAGDLLPDRLPNEPATGAIVRHVQERSPFVDKDGRVAEAEMVIGDDKLWWAGHEPGCWAGKPRRLEQLTLIWVDDVDAHRAHVRAAVTVRGPLTDASAPPPPAGLIGGLIR